MKLKPKFEWLKSEKLKRIGVLLAVLLVLSYIVYHAASLFREEIKTVVVGKSSESTSVTIDGYIFRDSSYVYSSNTGTVDFKVMNGERVALGDKIALVYENGNLASSKKILLSIDEQIALLCESKDKGYGISDLAALKKSASNAYYAIMRERAEGGLSGVSSAAERLLVALNSIEHLTNEDFSINDTINELENIRRGMLDGKGEAEEVHAKQSGYFYSITDGYENTFTASAAKELDAAALSSLISSASPPGNEKNLVGKISSDSVWYFVCEMPPDDSEKFVEGEYYTVNFLGGGGYEIKMSLERSLAQDGEETLLVFRTNVIPAGFGFERRQTVEIVTDTTSGIYIPSSAVYRVDGKESVYILKGSVVLLRRIEVIERGSDYYVVSDGGPEDAEEAYLKSNDLLIISGGNLFDGRILD